MYFPRKVRSHDEPKASAGRRKVEARARRGVPRARAEMLLLRPVRARSFAACAFGWDDVRPTTRTPDFRRARRGLLLTRFRDSCPGGAASLVASRRASSSRSAWTT